MKECVDLCKSPNSISENIPFQGIPTIDDVKYVDDITSYEDYVNNMRYLDLRNNRLEGESQDCQNLRRRSKRQLKNLFLSEFLSNEKSVNGLCINEFKDKKDYFFQSYVYIKELNQQDILEDGAYFKAIRIKFYNNDEASIENCLYYVEYEKLLSCRIEKDEFLSIYKKITDNFHSIIN